MKGIYIHIKVVTDALLKIKQLAIIWMDIFSTVVKCTLGKLWVYASDNTSSMEKKSIIYRIYLQTGNIYL